MPLLQRRSENVYSTRSTGYSLWRITFWRLKCWEQPFYLWKDCVCRKAASRIFFSLLLTYLFSFINKNKIPNRKNKKHRPLTVKIKKINLRCTKNTGKRKKPKCQIYLTMNIKSIFQLDAERLIFKKLIGFPPFTLTGLQILIRFPILIQQNTILCKQIFQMRESMYLTIKSTQCHICQKKEKKPIG